MSQKVYLHLFFLCGILCQVIFAALLHNDTRASSDIFLRKRRVINHLPDGQRKTSITEVKYLVKIRAGNQAACAGVILSRHTVITAAPCVTQNVTFYKVLSGALTDNRAKFHNVTSKLTHFGNLPHNEYDGIALITVHPAFVFSSKTGNIQLYTSFLPVNTEVTVFGWGHMYPIQPGTETRQKLRYMTLPIMDNRVCESIYHGRFKITDKHICTYCTQQYCARGDAGAPLTVQDKLVGIHVWKGEYRNQRNPDVYINLVPTEYSEWIREHTSLV